MRTARTAHRAAGAGVLATILALLAACTDGATHERPVPTTIATTAQSPTPSPTPEPTPVPTSASGLDFSDIDLTVPPPRPAALDEGPSPEAADAIARYFLLLFSYMFATHDSSEFEALSHPTCAFCKESLDILQGFVKNGITTERGAHIIHDTSVKEISERYFVVTMTYSQDWSRETLPSGEIVSESDGSDHVVRDFDVFDEDGVWAIAAVTSP